MLRGALEDQPGPARDIVALNAGAAIYAADRVGDLAEGVALAQARLADGSALQRLEALEALTASMTASEAG